MLAEENPDLRSLLALMLHQAGHQVSVIASIAELPQNGEQTFDLFLLGQASAKSGALSLCKQLRQSHPGKPIILYSTAALFPEQQEGLKAGATAYLVKPEDLLNVGQIASGFLTNQTVKPFIRAA